MGFEKALQLVKVYREPVRIIKMIEGCDRFLIFTCFCLFIYFFVIIEDYYLIFVRNLLCFISVFVIIPNAKRVFNILFHSYPFTYVFLITFK